MCSLWLRRLRYCPGGRMHHIIHLPTYRSAGTGVCSSFLPLPTYRLVRILRELDPLLLFSDIVSFSVSVDATSYIYASEIFPTPVRAKGLSVSISGLFIATILFLQAAPTAFDNVGWKYYLVFICITSIIFVVMWLVFPEVCSR